jgi:hypothetical protein
MQRRRRFIVGRVANICAIADGWSGADRGSDADSCANLGAS